MNQENNKQPVTFNANANKLHMASKLPSNDGMNRQPVTKND